MRFKKILAGFLSVMMLFSTLPTTAFAGDGSSDDGSDTLAVTGETSGAAQTGDKVYGTLQEAITAAEVGDTVTLLADVTEDVIIAADQEITLDLNGKTLTNKVGDTITNNGTLKMIGSGTVTNTVSGKTVLLNNGTASLNGGTFIREDTADNSYYTVVNHGTMTIDGAAVSNTGTYASCVENGWYYDTDVDGAANLTVVSGTISGGLNALKNDAGGILEITGGTITNDSQYAIMNWNIAVISGGNITCTAVGSGSVYPAAIYNETGESAASAGSLTISGGIITTTQSSTYALDNRAEASISGTAELTGGSSAVKSAGTSAITTISGGTFVGNTYYAVTASGGSKVEISDGSFSSSGSTSAYVIRAANSGTEVIITGGTFENTAAAKTGTATVHVGDSTKVAISGGTFSGATKYAVNNNGGKLTISGGEFTSPDSAVYVKNTKTAVTTISGGNFESTGEGKNAVTVGANGTLTVSGGTFSSTLDEAYLAEGFIQDETNTVKNQYAARIGGAEDNQYYGTLAEAIAAAKAGDTVTLLADVTEDVIIAADQEITLDLNGKTLTNKAGHTITNNGILTITDSSTGTVGTVDNVTHAKAALYNAEGATCIILAGQFTRSLENGQSGEDNGGNSFYTINNYGTMTIGTEEGSNDRIIVTANGHYSSLVHNGWQNSTDAQNKTAAMTIYGGTFTGGINTIKNDESGVLTITGGTFHNVTQYALMNWNEAVISGGTFASNKSSAVFNGADADTSIGKLTITDGTFTAPSDYYVVYCDSGTASITGGTYSSQYYTNKNSELNYTVQSAEDGSYAVVQCDATNSAASVTDGNGITSYYMTLQDALSVAEDGDTVTLLKDVVLTDNTVLKIADKGTEDAPLTLDLNGHTISGSNAQTGLLATSGTPGGILRVEGSHVDLTDTSDGEAKGGIINTYTGTAGALALVAYSSKERTTSLTIENGVRIEIENAGVAAAAVRVSTASGHANISVIINDAAVKSSGYAYSSSSSSNVSCVINGGIFTSALGVSKTGLNYLGKTVINGGTFKNIKFTYTELQYLGKGKAALYEKDGDQFAVTVGDAPADYVAHLTGTVYERAYLKSGDLYHLQELGLLTGTVEVAQSAGFTFPDGTFFGTENGTPKELTLDLAAGVVLSGSVPMAVANITVTGSGTVNEDAFVPKDADYEMISNGVTSELGCRVTSCTR